MKISIKLICLAIGMLTLSSGCTKKNSKNRTSVDQTNRLRELDEKKKKTQKKDEPKTPAPGSSPNDSETKQGDPAPTIPPIAEEKKTPPTEPKVVPDNNQTSSGSTTQVVPPPPRESSPPTKSQPEVANYIECVKSNLTGLLNSEKTKNSKLILPKKLLEIKTATSQKCAKPNLAEDQINFILNTSISEIAGKIIPDSIESIEFFYETENLDLSEDERKEIYNQFETDQTPLVSTSARPGAIPMSAIPIFSNTAAPSAAPAKTTGNTSNTTPPLATAQPAKPSAGPAANDSAAAKPIPAAGQPSAGGQKSAANAPGINMVALTNQIKDCFGLRVNAFVRQQKGDGKTSVTPKMLSDLRTSASHVCSRQILKDDKQIDGQLTTILVNTLNKEFPQSAASIKFFAETEAKNLSSDAKTKLYADYQLPVKTSAPVAAKGVKSAGTAQSAQNTQPAPATGKKFSPIEVKDIPAFEKCLNDVLSEILVQAKKEISTIRTPLIVAQASQFLKNICKIKETKESTTSLNSILSKGLLNSFPDSKTVIDYYLLTEQQTNLTNDDRIMLYAYYNVGLSIDSKSVRIQGKINSAQSTGNVVTYSLSKISGSLQTVIQPIAIEPYKKSIALDQMPIPNARFVFDFNFKADKTGTLTIIEGQKTFPLDFILIDGTVEQLRAQQTVKVMLTPQSWSKVIETQLRLNISEDMKVDSQTPLKFSSIQQDQNQTRICELTSEVLNCVDPDVAARMFVDQEELKKSMISAAK